MKFSSGTCRGVGTSRRMISSLVRKHNVAILAVLEPFQSEGKMRLLARKLKFANCMSNEQKRARFGFFGRKSSQ